MRLLRYCLRAASLGLVLNASLTLPSSVAMAAGEDEPLTVPLIKLEYPGNPPNIRMLYVRLLMLGNRKVNQPLLFDTGSSGVTIDCKVVLPKKLCSDAGIKIEKDTEIDGIIITTEKVTARYGGYTEFGHLAKARLSFGDAKRPAKTIELIALLIRYKKIRNSDGTVVGGPLWPLGTFGISPVGGIGAGQRITSPMGSVALNDKLRRGYRLNPIGRRWKVCTNERDDCPTIQSLQVGLRDQDRNDFQLQPIIQADPTHNFPTLSACIAWQTSQLCAPALFDTGNSTIMVRDPAGSVTSLPKGQKVSIDIQGQAQWAFKTEYRPEVEFGPHLDHHIIGIRYFEENGLIVDLDSKEIGLRLEN